MQLAWLLTWVPKPHELNSSPKRFVPNASIPACVMYNHDGALLTTSNTRKASVHLRPIIHSTSVGLASSGASHRKSIVGLQLNVCKVHRLAQPLKIHSRATSQVQKCSNPLGHGLKGCLTAQLSQHIQAHTLDWGPRRLSTASKLLRAHFAPIIAESPIQYSPCL